MTTPIHWHTQTAEAACATLQVGSAHGLAADAASQRLTQYGENRLVEAKPRPLWLKFLDQFKNFLVIVLLFAAVLAWAVGDLKDAVVILLVVVFNAALGFYQEHRAEQTLAALKNMLAASARVRRAGQIVELDAALLVPGDIVLLEAGDRIPADGRLLAAHALEVDEAALTGESHAVGKSTAALAAADLPLGDRLNMLYMNTVVTRGRAEMLVTATGMATEMGKLAGMIAAAPESDTPLQIQLDTLGKKLAAIAGLVVTLIFILDFARGLPWTQAAMTAVALAVAAIPEGLPAVVTVTLAIGMWRMAKNRAILKKLSAVETLGSTTVICSDKTGTLTQNRMHAELLVAEGLAWTPARLSPVTDVQREALTAAALCNDARPGDAPGSWLGDPTETALLLAAAIADVDKTALELATPRVQELPFDSERRCMTTFHRQPQGLVAYTKGAPESVLPRCESQWSPTGAQPLDRAAVLAQAEALALQGMRVLVLARREHAELPRADAADDVESHLQLLGLIALIDPPRPEAAQAVRECLAAGITPVMITGDHPATARAIARRLGIVTSDDAPVLTGQDLTRLDDATLRERVAQVQVYARVDPAQKIRIVEALQSLGQYVAMTGDGVNDAPALKRADIGVSMGLGGTDVARESSSLVLLDDNFATIVAAVREGRRIYDNIRKFVRYAMTGNSGEIWTLFLAPMLLLPIPLLPIHILWVNLVTDGLPGLALAAEPAERGIMQRPPRPPGESLFAHGMWQHILGFGLLIGGLCLGVQAWAISSGHAHWQTMVFTVLTLSQMAHVMAIRSETDALWRVGLLSNRPLLGAVLLTFALQMAVVYVPALNPIFKTEPLSLAELGICLGAAVVVAVAGEIEKAWRRNRAGGLALSADDPA